MCSLLLTSRVYMRTNTTYADMAVLFLSFGRPIAFETISVRV